MSQKLWVNNNEKVVQKRSCNDILIGVSLYTVDNFNNEINQNPKNVQDPRHKVNWKIGDGRTVASFVAQHKEFVLLDDILGDERFPDGVGHQGK